MTWTAPGTRLASIFSRMTVDQEWNPGNSTSAGLSGASHVNELRADSTSHRIITVEEAVEWVRAGSMLNLAPLCGGLPPALAWPYLKRVGDVVMPAAAGVTDASTSAS